MISFSVTTAKHEFAPAIFFTPQFIHIPGDRHCPLAGDNEPMILLKIPTTRGILC